jgi:S-DNA-T family DNA segregation ATPase FtsK/SpoIIIE
MAKKAKKKQPRDDRYKFLAGLIFLLLAVYITLSFTSFFFTWKTDQSFEWGQVVSSAEVTVENWGGKLGARLANLFIAKWFGVASFLLPFFLVVLAFKLFRIKLLPVKKTLQYSIIGTIVLSVFLGYLFQDLNGYLINGPGGGHGLVMARWLNALTGKTGTAFLMVIAWSAIILSLINKPLGELKTSIAGFFTRLLAAGKKNISPAPRLAKAKEEEVETTAQKAEPDVTDWQDAGEIQQTTPNGDTGQQAAPADSQKEAAARHTAVHQAEQTQQQEDRSGVAAKKETLTRESDKPGKKTENQEEDQDEDVKLTIEKTEEERAEHAAGSNEPADYDPTLELSQFQMPPIELLEDHGDGEGQTEINKEEIVRNKNRIVETLGNYKIQIDKIKATVGPTVTLYEIVPAPGIRISKIKNLEDDIALSLAALGIRIIAPIPGKGTIGIEVPNEKKEIVSMRSVLSSKNFTEARYELPLGLGRTISNETYVMDLSKMPHLLVAGATGQGKSVGLNAIITSLLYKKHPAQLKFVLVDPKKVELTLYSKIRNHYMAKIPDIEEPIVTENQDIIKTLNSLCVEMDERYNLLKAAHVRNIKEYNKKFIKKRLNPEKGHRYLPYIVVIIDEFADLIMSAGKEVESPLARLAQLARAIGIHLVIATQRPTTNIITGVIKANFPARIAFRVTSQIDSRTILDSTGANQLIGRGDMLISTGSDLTRLQCAFLETDDLETITDFISNQQGFAQPFELPEYEDEEGMNGESKKIDQWDDLFEEAARMVVRHQQGSTSLIQRKFSIGYNRAGRIMDQLEAANIVGPHEGSKARAVLFPDEYALEQYLNASSNENA